jgi:hypothetical protein
VQPGAVVPAVVVHDRAQPTQIGQALVSNSMPLNEEKNDSVRALSLRWLIRPTSFSSARAA